MSPERIGDLRMIKKTTYGYQVLGTLKRSEFNVGPNFPAPMISDVVNIKGDFELTAE
jgi:polyisoprenoid-binding protein YceI